MKKAIAIIFFSVLIGFAAIYAGRFKMGNITSYIVNQDKELHVLYNDESDLYASLIKTDSKGRILFKTDLPFYQGDYYHVYQEMKMDDNGNFYFRVEEYDTTTSANGIERWTIVKERVDLYNAVGKYQQTMFSIENEKQIENIIFQLQCIDNQLIVFCKEEDEYYIAKIEENTIKSNDYIDIAQDFFVKNDAIYINNILLTKNQEIIYSTNKGELYIQNDTDLIDLTNQLPQKSIIKTFSLDSSDNVYFREEISGIFYKYNIESSLMKRLYSSESELIEGITISDLNDISFVSNDFFSGLSVDAENWFFLGFGGDEFKISYVMRPTKEILITFSIWTISTAILIGILILLSKNIRSRLYLKIIFSFVPVYLISTIAFGYIIVKDNMENYSENLYKLLQSGGVLVAEHIPIDVFEEYDFNSDYMGEKFASLKKSLEDGILDIDQHLYDMQGYLILYQVTDKRIFRTITTDLSERRDKQEGAIPIEALFAEHDVMQIYNFLNTSHKSMDTPNDVLHLYDKDYIGIWLGAVIPLKNSEGEVIGLIENGVNKAITYDIVLHKTLGKMAILLTGITMFVFVFFLLVVKKYLDPLKSLESTMQEICKGRWSSKVRVTSGDEIGEISNVFNLMTTGISENMDNFIKLNEAYVKYTPDALIGMLDKKDILEVKLFDKNVKYMSMLFVNFNLVSNDEFSVESSAYFDMINNHFDKLFEITSLHGGVIERFDGMGMLILFERSAVDALKTSIQFREILDDNLLINETVRMIISSGETLIGVAGNKDRNSIITVSTEIMQIYSLNNRLNQLHIQYVITEDALKEITSQNVSYRFIGNVVHISKEQPMGIFEILSTRESGTKTKEIFESAVRLYIQGDFVSARKRFVDVLRIDENDEIAMYYLSLCDINQNEPIATWHGTILN